MCLNGNKQILECLNEILSSKDKEQLHRFLVPGRVNTPTVLVGLTLFPQLCFLIILENMAPLRIH